MKTSRYFKPRVLRKRVRRYLYRPPPANHPLLLGAPMASKAADASTLPNAVDLRNLCLGVRNQGSENACTGFATAAFREVCHAVAAGDNPLPNYLSPGYLYARARIVGGSFPDDSGGSVADEFDALTNYGVCPEAFLPFSGDPAEAPTPASDVAAAPFRVRQALQVDFTDAAAIKAVLASRQGIAIGFVLYESFEKPASGGRLAIPDVDNERVLGGHSVLVCGYDDSKSWWIARNQYGAGWGDGGYGFMPYGYEKFWTEAWTAAAQE